MEQRESAARQALRKKRARKRAVRTAVFLALAAALGAAAAFVILPQMNGEAADNAPQTEKRIATATLGTIEKTVFGSGEVQPASQPGVYARTDGTLAAYSVEVGDSVKAGDIVARLETTSWTQTLSNWNMICRPHSRKCALRRRIRSMSIKNSMTRTAICVTM